MPANESLLAAKLRRGGIARSPLPDTDMIGETITRNVEDRLRPLLKSMVGAMVTECRVTKLGEAVAGVSVPAMLGLVAVEDADTPLLVSIDSDLAFHLIDLTLGGDAGAAPAATARSFTAIDMAVCRLHLDALVAAFGEAIGTCLGRPMTQAMAVRDQRQNVSQLRIAPDYVDVLQLSVGLDIGEAARTGQLDMVLPLSTLDVIRAAVRDDGTASARERPNDLWRAAMRRAAAAAPVALDAVLHRDRMTLAALRRLAVGQMIEIPAAAPDRIALTLGQPGGRTAVVALARLGVYEGDKVVKLADAPDRRVAAHVARALASPARPEEPTGGPPRLPAPDAVGEPMPPAKARLSGEAVGEAVGAQPVS